jgi:parvulin-like peptidyl-prolyl isomerase
MPRCGFTTLILLLLVLLPGCKDREKPPSRILLKVDGRTVSLEQFQHDFQQILPVDRTLPDDEEQALRRSYLAQRIDHELLLAEASRLGLQVTAEELGRAKSNHLDQYPDGDFDRILAEKGLSPDDWERLLYEELLVEKALKRMVRDRVHVPEEEIVRYFETHRQDFTRPEQVRARQITVTDEVEGRRIVDMLRGGMVFEEAARRYSVSPDAEEGGDLGLFARGEMPEAFDEAVFDLPVGRISDLIQSEYGYHIFTVEQHLQPLQPDLKTVRAEIVAILGGQREEELYREWLQTLRQKASIEVDWTLL